MARLAAAVVMAMLALGLLTSSTALAGKHATDLRVGWTQPIDTINPLHGLNDSSYELYDLNWDWLIAFSQKDLTPDRAHSLAKSWTQSGDGLTWTYHLRHGIRWSDGVPFTSKDVAFTMNLSIKHQTYFSTYLLAVKSVDTPDPYTVVAHLKRPSAYMDQLWMPILPEHVWKHADPKHLDRFNPPLPLVGTGPYTLTHFDSTGTSVLVRNRYFWQRNTGPQRILIISYGTNDEMAQDLKLNRLDVMSSADPAQYRNLASTPDVRTYNSATSEFDYIEFNVGKNPAKDVHVKVVQDPAIRQALSYAINRQQLVTTSLLGLGTPGNSSITTFYSTWYRDFSKAGLGGYTFDQNKARSILDNAGWAVGANGIRVKNGVKAEFTLLDDAEDHVRENEAKLVQAMARSVGIQIDLRLVSTNAWTNLVYATAGNGDLQPDYDASITYESGDPTPYFLLSIFTTDEINGWNDSEYSNPTVDHLFTQLIATPSRQKRQAIAERIERIVLKDAPYIFLETQNQLTAVNDRTWHNWTVSPQPGGFPMSLYDYRSVINLTPGTAAASSYPGVPWAYGVLGLMLLVWIGRRVLIVMRERREPLELPGPATAMVPGPATTDAG